MKKNPNYFYKGAIHIHTKLSDGTGNIDSITKVAKKAGLDWIIVTDHNHYDTDEGIINGVYVIKGEEISPSNHDHYLALGISEEISCNDNPQINIDNVRMNNGFGFAAHPDEGTNENGESRKNSHHCIKWTNKKIKPDGVEIWNWFSNWADNLDDRNIFRLAYSYLFKHKIVKNPYKCTLKWWDELNLGTEVIIPAIGGVDAHALKFYKYIIPVTVFSYETSFQTVTNIINLDEKLSNDFQTAKVQIIEAIKCGRNIIVNRKILKSIPDIYILSDDKIINCGEKVSLVSNLFLNFKSEDILDVCIMCDGQEYARLKTKTFNIPINKIGKYRLEICYNGKGFVYTNPFVVTV